jgi:uracil-DNA glycosylase
MNKLINIPDDWYVRLQPTIESSEFMELAKFIAEERKTKQIFPLREEIFRAFQLTPYMKTRVTILSMDPYFTEYKGEPVACGLSFAPRNRDFVPPSLRIIYQKIKETCYPDDLAFPIDLNIENWAKQGVLMLNSALTVEKGNAGSHLKQWDFFTKAVLEALNELPGHIFVLWGKDAQKYKKYLNPESQYILECSHPASATYTGGRWECDHFTEINRILQLYNGETIDWLELPHTVTHLKDFKIDQ